MGVFSVALVGEALPNEDGSSRQEEIARCHVGEGVRLVLDPDEEPGGEAVRVLSHRGVEIGRIGPGNAWLGQHIRDGGTVRAFIESLVGREGNLGVVLEVSTEPRATSQGAQKSDEKGGSGPLRLILLLLVAAAVIGAALVAWTQQSDGDAGDAPAADEQPIIRAQLG